MSFKNKVVLITGGSAGIGAATADQFAKEGANIAIVGRNEAKLKEVAQRCEKLGATVLVIKADVGNDKEAKTIVENTVKKFGKLDILVNNAGVYKMTTLASPDVLDTYDQITRVNVRAVVHMTSLAAPYLAKTKGNIVNVSSVLGESIVQSPECMMYAVSKAALNSFSRAAAYELAVSGVRVNVVSPGPVQTQMLTDLLETRTSPELAFTLLDRISEPVEVADVIMFLASDKAKGVTGSNFSVDNGVLVKF